MSTLSPARKYKTPGIRREFYIIQPTAAVPVSKGTVFTIHNHRAVDGQGMQPLLTQLAAVVLERGREVPLSKKRGAERLVLGTLLTFPVVTLQQQI